MTPDFPDYDNMTVDQVLKTPGLVDSIRNAPDPLEAYRKQAVSNLGSVRKFLQTVGTDFVMSADFLEVHRRQFAGISDFGGQPSSHTMCYGGDDDFVLGAPPENIREEYALLDEQMEEIWENARTMEGKVRALAFQYARYLGIHGLRDGNKRTCRAVGDFAFCRLSGLNQEAMKIDRSSFNRAATEAIRYNNIGRLSKLIAMEYNLDYNGPEVYVAPFEVSASRSNDEPTMASTRLHSNSLDEPISLVNRWLRPEALTRIASLTGGYPTEAYQTAVSEFSRRLQEPMTVGKTVDLVREFAGTGAIAHRDGLDPEEYLKPALKRRDIDWADDGSKNRPPDRHMAGLEYNGLEHATYSCSPKIKEQFRRLLHSEIRGETTASQVDAIYRGLFDGDMERQLLRERQQLRDEYLANRKVDSRARPTAPINPAPTKQLSPEIEPTRKLAPKKPFRLFGDEPAPKQRGRVGETPKFSLFDDAPGSAPAQKAADRGRGGESERFNLFDGPPTPNTTRKQPPKLGR